MAGIIGNMTAQARLRRGRKEVESNKCVYTLHPFSSAGFRPERDNKYLAACQNRIDMENLVRESGDCEELDREDLREIVGCYYCWENDPALIIFIVGFWKDPLIIVCYQMYLSIYRSEVDACKLMDQRIK